MFVTAPFRFANWTVWLLMLASMTRILFSSLLHLLMTGFKTALTWASEVVPYGWIVLLDEESESVPGLDGLEATPASWVAEAPSDWAAPVVLPLPL